MEKDTAVEAVRALLRERIMRMDAETLESRVDAAFVKVEGDIGNAIKTAGSVAEKKSAPGKWLQNPVTLSKSAQELVRAYGRSQIAKHAKCQIVTMSRVAQGKNFRRSSIRDAILAKVPGVSLADFIPVAKDAN